jgi:hypothetical protein
MCTRRNHIHSSNDGLHPDNVRNASSYVLQQAAERNDVNRRLRVAIGRWEGTKRALFLNAETTPAQAPDTHEENSGC